MDINLIIDFQPLFCSWLWTDLLAFTEQIWNKWRDLDFNIWNRKIKKQLKILMEFFFLWFFGCLSEWLTDWLTNWFTEFDLIDFLIYGNSNLRKKWGCLGI